MAKHKKHLAQKILEKDGLHDHKIFERLALGTAILTIMRLSIKRKRDMRTSSDGFEARMSVLLTEKSKKVRTAWDLLLFDTLVIVSSTLPFAVCRKLAVEKKKKTKKDSRNRSRLNRQKYRKDQNLQEEKAFNTGCI